MWYITNPKDHSDRFPKPYATYFEANAVCKNIKNKKYEPIRFM